MGDLNLSQYQARVLLALGNLQTSHPAVAAGLHTQAINSAAERIIRRFPDKFPEHHNRSWTQGPTVVGDNLISLPSNLLVLKKVRHSDGATITAGDWSSADEQVVSRSDVETIGLLDKASTVTGYPTLWDRKGTNLLYYPTTRTGYTTTFRFYGISRETPLSVGGDAFRMDRDWDEAIILFGAAKLARMIGYAERADELEAAAKREIGESLSVVIEEAGPMSIGSEFDFTSERAFWS